MTKARITARSSKPQTEQAQKTMRMYLIPCSCGTTFAVSPDYDQAGSRWNCYLSCPGCGKRHDPKNRVLEMGYRSEGYWTVDKC